MKKYLILIVSIFCLMQLYANTDSTKLYTSPYQIRFNKLIADRHNSYNKAKTKAEQNKVLKNQNKKIQDFADSTILFVNWVGKVDNVKYSEEILKGINIRSKDISIVCEVNENCSYTFIESVVLSNDYTLVEDNKDGFYDRVRNLQIGQTVYFDGVLWKEEKGNFQAPPEYEELSSISNIIFDFCLNDINTKKGNDDLPSILWYLIKKDFLEKCCVLNDCDILSTPDHLSLENIYKLEEIRKIERSMITPGMQAYRERLDELFIIQKILNGGYKPKMRGQYFFNY